MSEAVVAAIVVSMAISAILTPLARRLALARNLVAAVRPDRLHREPRPYGGGLAIMVVLAVLAVGIQLFGSWAFNYHCKEEAWPWADWLLRPLANLVWAGSYWNLRELGFGAVLFFIVGLIDDRFALSALSKFGLQLLAAGLWVWSLGFLPSAALTAILFVFWIVAVVNAYNMLDHADGLAALVGIIALVFIGVGGIAVEQIVPMGVIRIHPDTTFIMAFMLAGAMAGFLFYNFPPARLFMGDAGSSLVGYLLAILSLTVGWHAGHDCESLYAGLAPLALLAVPLFDMVCVTAGRLWRRQNPFKGDATSHLAHRMLARGTKPRTVVLFAAGMTAITGAASVVMYHVQGVALLATWGVVAAVCVMMLIARRRPRTAPDIPSPLAGEGRGPAPAKPEGRSRVRGPEAAP